mmetsp:Transcript_13061/g.15000  ORF Transcript_13061/g.15000 Transcript_13061/m.15000 type:complete len:183 (+) Transcript_13061:25-573(+)
MGNTANHKRWFSDKKRKVLLLGIENSGKTTFLKWLKTGKFESTHVPTKDLEIENIKTKTLDLIVFDPAGGERQRVFWRHHYTGTQGIIFFIDVSAVQEQQLVAAKELNKILAEQELQNSPILIVLNKVDMINEAFKDKILEALGVKLSATDDKRCLVVLGSLKAEIGIKEGMEWLSKTMVAI